MGTMTNYVRWRGDLSFRERAMTDLDQMVISGIAYFALDDVYVPGKRQRLGDLLSKQIENDTLKSTSLDPKETAEEFIKAVAASRRFGDAVVLDYTSVYDAGEEVQFAATTLKLDDGTVSIGFRGTDESLAGWREDMMISFTSPPAQKMALDHLCDALKKYRGVYVSGHSKGGNLAMYAVCLLPDSLFGRVKAVHLHDSPGLCNEIIPIELERRIDGIATMILPEDSVVGRIFEPEISRKIIVKSSYSGPMAHSIYSWQAEDNALVTADGFSAFSNRINEWLDKFLANRSLEERKALVDQIFDFLKDGGYETLSELKANAIPDIASSIVKKVEAGISGIKPKELISDSVEAIRSKILKS